MVDVLLPCNYVEKKVAMLQYKISELEKKATELEGKLLTIPDDIKSIERRVANYHAEIKRISSLKDSDFYCLEIEKLERRVK